MLFRSDDEDDEEYTPRRTKGRSTRAGGASQLQQQPGQRQRTFSTSTASSVGDLQVPDEPLMKKTRGRRVPTKDEVAAAGLTAVRHPSRTGPSSPVDRAPG